MFFSVRSVVSLNLFISFWLWTTVWWRGGSDELFNLKYFKEHKEIMMTVNINTNLFAMLKKIVDYPGGHSAHRHTGGGKSKKFTGHPKISAHFP